MVALDLVVTNKRRKREDKSRHRRNPNRANTTPFPSKRFYRNRHPNTANNYQYKTKVKLLTLNHCIPIQGSLSPSPCSHALRTPLAPLSLRFYTLRASLASLETALQASLQSTAGSWDESRLGSWTSSAVNKKVVLEQNREWSTALCKQLLQGRGQQRQRKEAGSKGTSSKERRATSAKQETKRSISAFQTITQRQPLDKVITTTISGSLHTHSETPLTTPHNSLGCLF